jgi:hypothetical protein
LPTVRVLESPESGEFPDKLTDAREFSVAGEPKEIGDWFAWTASATIQSCQTAVVSGCEEYAAISTA